MNLSQFFGVPDQGREYRLEITSVKCYIHDQELPCQQCEINKARGYSVMVLAGRCANGSELDSGMRWHAVADGYAALCGAKPGRRSAGWSSWYVKGQEVTCPRCLKKLSKSN